MKITLDIAKLLDEGKITQVEYDKMVQLSSEDRESLSHILFHSVPQKIADTKKTMKIKKFFLGSIGYIVTLITSFIIKGIT